MKNTLRYASRSKLLKHTFLMESLNQLITNNKKPLLLYLVISVYFKLKISVQHFITKDRRLTCHVTPGRYG